MKDIIIGLWLIIVQSALISAVICLFKWIGSLIGLCGAPTWSQFLFGGIGVAVFLLVYSIYKTLQQRKGL